MPEKKPLEWSPKSQRNIEFIRDYIAADNPTAAQSVIDEYAARQIICVVFP